MRGSPSCVHRQPASAAAIKIALSGGVCGERRNPDQRDPARDAGRGGRERHVAGGARRARLQARLCRQCVQGPRAAGDARHAGGVRRYRAGARGVPACLGYRAPLQRVRRWRRIERQWQRSRPLDQRTGARRPGDRGAGGQGSDQHQGRAAVGAPVDSLALPGAAAVCAHAGHLGAHRGRGRAPAAEGCADAADRR